MDSDMKDLAEMMVWQRISTGGHDRKETEIPISVDEARQLVSCWCEGTTFREKGRLYYRIRTACYRGDFEIYMSGRNYRLCFDTESNPSGMDKDALIDLMLGELGMFGYGDDVYVVFTEGDVRNTMMRIY